VPAIRKTLRKTEAEVRRASLRPTIPPGRAGVLLAGALRFDVVLAPRLVLVPQ
jgi:hypothetical protein